MFDFDDLEVHAPKLRRESPGNIGNTAGGNTSSNGTSVKVATSSAGGAVHRSPSAERNALLDRLKQASVAADRKDEPGLAAHMAHVAELEAPHRSPSAERNSLLERLKQGAAAADRMDKPAPAVHVVQEYELEAPPPTQQSSNPDPEMDALLARLKSAANATYDDSSLYATPEPDVLNAEPPAEPPVQCTAPDDKDLQQERQKPDENTNCFVDVTFDSSNASDVSDEAANPSTTVDIGTVNTGAVEEEEKDTNDKWAVERIWDSRTALFEIFGKVLPMHLDNEDELPCNVAKTWEAWGISYASRLKFGAQADSPVKWLNPRNDTLPGPPSVTRLEGKSSILDAVALALTQRDEEAQSRAIATCEKRQKADHGGRWKRQSERFRWRSPVEGESGQSGPGVNFRTQFPLFQSPIARGST